VDYLITMSWLLIVELAGLVLQIEVILTAYEANVGERFVRVTPLLARLLSANTGIQGLLARLGSDK
jgi:hypothetical protein